MEVEEEQKESFINNKKCRSFVKKLIKHVSLWPLCNLQRCTRSQYTISGVALFPWFRGDFYCGWKLNFLFAHCWSSILITVIGWHSIGMRFIWLTGRLLVGWLATLQKQFFLLGMQYLGNKARTANWIWKGFIRKVLKTSNWIKLVISLIVSRKAHF